MMRWLSPKLLFLCGITLIALLVRLCLPQQDTFGPRTLEEAAAIAEARGLFCRSNNASDSSPNNTCAIIVSTHPVTTEQAHDIRLNRPDHAGWRDTVAIYSSWRSLMPNFDDSMSVVWGELFVFGDPHLIEKLTGRKPSGGRADGDGFARPAIFAWRKWIFGDVGKAGARREDELSAGIHRKP